MKLWIKQFVNHVEDQWFTVKTMFVMVADTMFALRVLLGRQ
jgi:hypothetical protein